MTRCPLFVELCCGSAAVTLRLLSAHARPPISYMGAKTGYATAILHALGLRSGQGADACMLVEAGPWAKAWRLLTTPDGCRAVAAVIRAWIGEDARALWERLRSEPVAGGDSEDVARWLWIAGNSWKNDCETWKRQDERDNGGASTITCETLADRVDCSWPPTIVSNAPVQEVTTGILPAGTVVYFDPPYQGTTGYKHGLSRDQVLEVARRWADAGAIVCVSEAEPLPLPGWHHVEITGARVGQKRTFSKQQREWLTMNREPVTRPMIQGGLEFCSNRSIA